MEMPKDQPVIAVVTPGVFPVPSPMSSSVEIVAVHMSAQLKDHASVHVIGIGDGARKREEWIDGVRYVRPTRHLSRYVKAVCIELRRLKPDIVQIENRPKLAIPIRKAVPESRIWISLHSITYVSPPHLSGVKRKTSFAAADGVLVNSRFLQRYMIRRYPVLQSKIAVNHLGTDMERFLSRWTKQGAAMREEWLQRQGLTGRQIVLFVGRLLPIKGVHHLLRMMPKLVKRHPDAMLIVAGGAFCGTNRTTRYVTKLLRMGKRIRGHVRFVTYIPHDEIPRWFQAADVVAVPSADKEAFGLVNVEAMACGSPVVATAVGGIPEIVENGVTGVLLSPLHVTEQLLRSVSELLDDPEKRRRMGEAGVAKVASTFTWRHAGGRLLSVYREFAGHKHIFRG